MVPFGNPQQIWPRLCMNVVVTIARDRALLPYSFSLYDGNKARAWDGRAGEAASSLHVGHIGRGGCTRLKPLGGSVS